MERKNSTQKSEIVHIIFVRILLNMFYCSLKQSLGHTL